MFTSWSTQSVMKSMNMISTIGRDPATAAPMAMPVKAGSEIGVLRMRSVPYFSTRPRVTPKEPP